MRNQPSLQQLLQRTENSKYTLVLVSARRARQLVDNKDKLLKGNRTKPVSLALDELVSGDLTYHLEAGNLE